MEKLDKQAKTREAINKLTAEVEYVYCNRAAFSMNNWDIRIAFGDEQPNDVIRPKVGIIMSYQHAKALTDLLTKNLALLEGMLGGDIQMIKKTPRQEDVAAIENDDTIIASLPTTQRPAEEPRNTE